MNHAKFARSVRPKFFAELPLFSSRVSLYFAAGSKNRLYPFFVRHHKRPRLIARAILSRVVDLPSVKPFDIGKSRIN